MMTIKKACILVILCMFAGLALSSCRSSKLCPAYRTVSHVEQPASADQPAS